WLGPHQRGKPVQKSRPTKHAALKESHLNSNTACFWTPLKKTMRLSNPRAGIALRRRQVGLVSRLGNRQERERHQRENHDLFHFFINPFSLNFCLLSTVNVLVLSYVRSDPYKVFCLKYSDTGTNDWDERTRAGVDSARKPL